MSKRIATKGPLTIALDLGDKHTEACVLDGGGEVVGTFRVRTTEPALDRALSRFEASRVVLDGGDPLAVGEAPRDGSGTRGGSGQSAAGAAHHS